MDGYTVFWAKDRVEELKKAGDAGPIRVVYGGRHLREPSLVKVKVGDVIFPVALANGKLAVMARLPVDRVEPAFEYQLREAGLVRGAIVPKGVRPRTNESNQAPTCSFAPHQKPITCCSESAASGNGSSIEPRIMPDEFVPRLLFGPSDDSLKSLRFDKNGKLSVVSFSGYVRRMSPETLEIFESLFA